MLNKLEIFFGKAAIYIVAFFILLSAVLGVGWYISNLKLDSARHQTANAELRLTESNASYNSIKLEFKKLGDTLTANSLAQIEQQNAISRQLADVAKTNQPLTELGDFLRNRPSASNCAIPKDLQDAWNRL